MEHEDNRVKINMHSKEFPTGVGILNDPFLNKGTAFIPEERQALGLRGLLPPRVNSEEEQVARALENIRRYPSDLEKYIWMISLQDANRTLFYRVLIDNLEELMPIIYTPTVGKACQEYGHIFTRPRGIFITPQDAGSIADLLRNWPYRDIRIIVVTDGERILGLGDLGANGMGIPVGKLSLYTACAGIDPAISLPVTLDMGTENEELLRDPLYIGAQGRRLRGPQYDALFDEFITAAQEVFPEVLIQLEDFGNTNAFRLLQQYRDRCCLFDDDIQGTGAVALSGLYSALRVTGRPLADQTICFLGAGEAGIGIANLIVSAMVHSGLSEDEARRRCWFVDSTGLVVTQRDNLAHHKLPYAHEHEFLPDMLSAVRSLKPTVIIGVSGQTNAFTPEILETMSAINERPIIFSLSNPTSKSECTAEAAYTHTGGRALFASGSPFDPVTIGSTTLYPGQGNNAYIFPGVGMGAIASRATRVTDEMFFVAAQILARQVSEDDLARGRLFPALDKIRPVSAAIAVAVAEVAYERGLARAQRPADIPALIQSHIYEPVYTTYTRD